MTTPTQMQERGMSFLDANPVFTRGEFAAAIDLPKGSAPVGRFLGQQVAAKRIRRLRREVFSAVPDHKTPGASCSRDTSTPASTARTACWAITPA